MKTTMVGFFLVWAVFTFIFYRGFYLRRARHRDYSEFAQATYTAVKEHFEELRSKRERGIIDKGFKVVDDSDWRETIFTFASEIVLNELRPGLRDRVQASQAMSTSFTSFTQHFINELTAHSTMPPSYDLNEAIRSVENDADLIAYFKGDVKYLPGKALISRLTALVLAIGLLGQAQPSFASAGAPFTPLEACNALGSIPGFNLNQSGYSELYDEVYSCGTPYKELGEGDLPNNLALYGRGTRTEVTRVKVMLNVNQASHAARDTKTLAKVCATLVNNLAGGVPADLEKRVSQGKAFEVAFEGYRVFLTKSIWPTGRGYELSCGISTMDHKE